MWRVGNKAYCSETRARWVSGHRWYESPNGIAVAGTTYLVTGLYVNADSGLLGLVLAGFPAEFVGFGTPYEVGWDARYFNKVITRTERESACNVIGFAEALVGQARAGEGE